MTKRYPKLIAALTLAVSSCATKQSAKIQLQFLKGFNALKCQYQ